MTANYEESAVQYYVPRAVHTRLAERQQISRRLFGHVEQYIESRIRAPLLVLLHGQVLLNGRFSSAVGRNMLCCAQRYSYAVEDLIFNGSVRSVC